MQNPVKKNKYLLLFKRTLFFLFLGYSLFSPILKKEFTQESLDPAFKILYVLVAVYFVIDIRYQLKYNREHFFQNIKEGLINIKSGLKSIWPQLLFITLLFVFWFLYQRNLI